MDVGCYCVSALRLLCGEPERRERRAGRAAATASTSASPASLRFPGDVLGTFDCGMDVHRRHAIEVVGARARSSSRSPWQTPLGAADPDRPRRRAERIDARAVDPYARELDEFGAAIAEGRAPRLGRDDALGQARMIEALYRAAADGVVVSP